ncbi:MAG: pyridine nucleotide-disulfide oxidoreductase [Deltaproteobacteria bacterium]|nr:MAG: pyridine nucleotide-disulfide oxidoreductase [Deltaproteobacteria bacterium]
MVFLSHVCKNRMRPNLDIPARLSVLNQYCFLWLIRIADQKNFQLKSKGDPIMTQVNSDVIIIGAGPSGTSAAALIHQAGFKVAVIEKEEFPRFIIGESLLPRCMDLLEEAGLIDAVKARDYIVKHGAVFLTDDQRTDFEFGNQFTDGWGYTWQVPRDDFDHTLATAVEKMGVDIFWRHTVTDADCRADSATVTATGPDGNPVTFSGRFVLDASGFGRVLPRLMDLDLPSALPRRDSVFTHITGDRRPAGDAAGKIWICMLPENSWLWIIPFSNGKTSVGVVAEPAFIDNLGGSLDDKLSAIIDMSRPAADRLADRKPDFPARRIDGYSIAVKTLCGDGYALTGNATEFLDPVFSSGVTLALESANRAAKTLIRQLKGETVDWDKDYAAYLGHGVEVFRTYVNAWYDGALPTVFFSDKATPDIRSQICSVLAGYVWDMDNPFVAKHEKAVDKLAQLCDMRANK